MLHTVNDILIKNDNARSTLSFYNLLEQNTILSSVEES